MWILPKQLHTSAYVPDMVALSLDLNESFQLCAQSLFVRSKPSLARTWSQRWKRDLWTQHLFGRILKPSLGQSFVTAWTSSLEVTHANHSVAQASDLEEKTPDTCGPTFQTGFDFFNQASASLRMSRGTLALDSEKSLATWKALVIERRSEYSARLNAARLTRESECLFSLPTPTAMEWKDIGEAALLSRIDKGGRVARRLATLNLQPSTGRVKVQVRLLEQMMGVSIGWTECASSETELSQQQRN